MIRFICTLAAMMVSVSAFACHHLQDADLSAVDAGNSTVVVVKNDQSTTFTAGAKTRIVIDGKAAAFGDLKAGDKVSVDYESSTDVVKISVVRQG